MCPHLSNLSVPGQKISHCSSKLILIFGLMIALPAILCTFYFMSILQNYIPVVARLQMFHVNNVPLLNKVGNQLLKQA